MSEVDSRKFIDIFWSCFKIMGFAKRRPFQGFFWIICYYIYRFSVVGFITILYPVHVAMVLFSFSDQSENVKNFANTITIVSCSLKFLIFASQLEKLLEVEKLLEDLDRRIKAEDERLYFKHSLERKVKQINYAILGLFVLFGAVAGVMAFMTRGERHLLYKAWFPLDWRTSLLNFYIANTYQFFGLCLQMVESYATDCLPPVLLCLLSEHTKLLGMRISKIAHENSENLSDNVESLLKCIKDQKKIYRLHRIVEGFISIPLFLQICVNIFCIGIGMAALYFYSQTSLDRIYYFLYSIGMFIQIFPVCFYGSDFQLSLNYLSQAAFSCNWYTQNRLFRRHLLLFVERTLNVTTVMAGGMLRIHLGTFFSVCKTAYSLFTVLLNMNNGK